MTAVFLYGTLLDRDIRRYVFGDSIREAQLRRARAEGYCTMTYPGESFPVLVRAPGSLADGIVLLEPGAEALERMAHYEGDLYRLDELQVITQDGETLQAQYNRASEDNLVLEQSWCFNEWQATGREAFLARIKFYSE